MLQVGNEVIEYKTLEQNVICLTSKDSYGLSILPARINPHHWIFLFTRIRARELEEETLSWLTSQITFWESHGVKDCLALMFLCTLAAYPTVASNVEI